MTLVAKETIEESFELLQCHINKYQLEAYLIEMVKMEWQSEYMEAVTLG